MFEVVFLKKLIYFLLLFSLFVYLLSELTPIPSAARYFGDLILALIVVGSLKQGRNLLEIKQIRTIWLSISVLALYSLISAIVNQVPILLMVYAFRNTFRFYFFFLMVYLYWDQEDVKRFFNLLLIIQLINVPLTIYQYLFITKNGDNIGGIFGTGKGVNGSSNLFFLILVIYYSLAYFHKKAKFLQFLATISSTVVLAVIAEIKYFFIEILVIAIVIVLLNLRSKRSAIILVTMVAGLGAGFLILQRMIPGAFYTLIKIDNLVKYMTMTEGGYYIGRAGAFGRINDLFFGHDIRRILFGLGFGSCEESSFAFLTSDFARVNGHLNYRYFSHALTYLETGLVGVVFYLFTFLAMVIDKLRERDENNSDQFSKQMIILLFVTILLNFVYNNSLKYEISYLVHFALAVPFVLNREIPLVMSFDKNCE